MTITAYPLCWPRHFARTRIREASKFRTSLTTALTNVQKSLQRFAADSRKQITNVVISSNVTLSDSKPDDPGVAVWFTWDGLQVCIPVDRYRTVSENLQAVHHIIEARRTELRHGTLQLVRATFTGFAALPAPDERSWREVLGIPPGTMATVERINHAYRDLAAKRHPDKGGSSSAMAELNKAREDALRDIGARR